ncbi:MULTISPECIES: sensor histidine kinase [unclassified Streptomyces]|uniref:sensor histidine kinase n=1 Tax=unclassified Streptomyces TaxID=2593676 RepID=UPI0009A132A2|nr:histidine kinase [Streptomyces sp. CB02058]
MAEVTTGRRPGEIRRWARPKAFRAGRATKTDTAKVELYTRATFQMMAGIEFGGLAVPLLFGDRRPSDVWLFLLLLAHSAMCAVMSSRGLDLRLGHRENPVRLTAAAAALTGACLLACVLLLDTGAISETDDFGVLLMGFAAFGLGSLSLGLPTTGARVWLVLGAATGTSVFTAALGMGWRQTWLNFTGVSAAGALFVATYVFSAWLAGVVRQLDAARELETRVAVAEERLRFGRDMHDVMGRNLAVMALKSELAVQLAERGRPEAVSQMAEVQRIAQESQREIRDIVRGYREAGLRTELEGALGVLKAAGIDCTVHGVGDDLSTALPGDVQSALGWVVREATTNVLRHGDPRSCAIRLSTAELPGGTQEVVLMVQNDGVPEPAGPAGGNAGRRPAPGTGLAGLRERLAAHDGTLEAGPVPGSDRFRLTARVPLPDRDRSPARPAGREDGTA